MSVCVCCLSSQSVSHSVCQSVCRLSQAHHSKNTRKGRRGGNSQSVSPSVCQSVSFGCCLWSSFAPIKEENLVNEVLIIVPPMAEVLKEITNVCVFSRCLEFSLANRLRLELKMEACGKSIQRRDGNLPMLKEDTLLNVSCMTSTIRCDRTSFASMLIMMGRSANATWRLIVGITPLFKALTLYS